MSQPGDGSKRALTQVFDQYSLMETLTVISSWLYRSQCENKSPALWVSHLNAVRKS